MPKQIAIIDLRGFVCADSTIFFGLSLLNCSFTVNRFTHALVRKVLVLLWPLSDGILYIQRTIVKNLTKTMEIIIDFFFIWKKCDIMI